MDSLEIIQQVAAGQDGVVTAAQALQAGFTRQQITRLCRNGRWRRLAHGAYLVHDQVTGHRAQIRAAVLSLGPAAVAVLSSAAALHDIAGLPPDETVHVSVPVSAPRPQRTSAGLVVHQLTLSAADVTDVGGVPATTVSRTVADLLLRTTRYAAVSLLDSAFNKGLLLDADLPAVLTLIRGRRGACAARRHLSHVDGRAQSPLETRVRLRCVDGGVPPDTLQYAVRDTDGYLLGVADLAWRAARLIVEADGAGPHSTPQALYEDRRRQNRIANAGWRVLRFTWADTMRPDYIPFTVRQALERR